MYTLLRPFIFKLDAEDAHNRMKALTQKVARLPLSSTIIDTLYNFEEPKLHTTLFGKQFKNPVGLSAGFDKNAEMFTFMEHLGFSFIEMGTITFHPQEGNARPRLFRLTEDKAIINRMGFNGDGAEKVATRLSHLPKKSRAVKVINIGKSKIVDNKDATQDYMRTFKLLLPYMDMCVVNVSSPNTPGLRELQGKEALTEILGSMMEYKQREEETKDLPILVKIAPDLNNDQLIDVLEVVKAVGLSGIVATNTTIERPESLQSERKIETGGLSGLPVQKRSTEVIQFLYKESKGSIPIIGVGGIFTAEDAYEKIKAGASLVEIYTGLIYEGPGIVKKINKGLVRLLEQDGFTNIEQAIGKNNNF